jgi:MoxR-like ATPase
LIQGPPGTGKTKVITAIERCLAVLADEGVEPSHRILVSAAQHDAVRTSRSGRRCLGSRR